MMDCAQKSARELNSLTRNALKTTLCRKIQWLRDQHQQLPPECIDVMPDSRREELVAPVAKSAFTIVEEPQKYDVEHTSLVRERHFEVQFWGFCEHTFNDAMKGSDAFERLGFAFTWTRTPLLR